MQVNGPNLNEWQIDNLPNRLTLLRIALVPVVITALLLSETSWAVLNQYQATLSYLAAWSFAVAAITDLLDGVIARKKNLVTLFGSFLDPMADKFLVVSSLLVLQHLGRIPVILVIILVFREMYIMALRLLAQERGLIVPVSVIGKYKTVGQMIGIPLLMANDTPWWFCPMPLIGKIFIHLAAILSLVSAILYTLKLFQKLRQRTQHMK